MRTKSIWGKAPTRLYRLIDLAEKECSEDFTSCIVGCSDGKFLIPFGRKKHRISGYDIDEIALFGGVKTFPVVISKVTHNYTQNFVPEQFDTEERIIHGCQERITQEGIEQYCNIEKRDFYHSTIEVKFDVVFTSCSLHYSINKDFTLKEKVDKLKDIVKMQGYLYIDYMMAINENDFEQYPESKFFRKGEMQQCFDMNWQILSLKENNKVSFEAAHVDVPYDHFHKFGYLLARRIK
jgi:hypothetical protein